MKINSVSNQSFKAFEFSDNAILLLQKRYKSAGQQLLHENLVMDQSHNPVNVKFDTNAKGTALQATISILTNSFQYIKNFKENCIDKHSSPAKFITKMYNKANEVRLNMENAEAFKDALDNYNNLTKEFIL